MADRTRRELIAMLRTPTFSKDTFTYSEFIVMATKLDVVAEALAVLLDEQRPKSDV